MTGVGWSGGKEQVVMMTICGLILSVIICVNGNATIRDA